MKLILFQRVFSLKYVNGGMYCVNGGSQTYKASFKLQLESFDSRLAVSLRVVKKI